MSRRVIEEKEQLVTHEFTKLKEQFREVTSKLKAKLQQEIERETKLKNVLANNETLAREVNSLKQELKDKGKQAHLFRLLLHAQEDPNDNNHSRDSCDNDSNLHKEKEQKEVERGQAKESESERGRGKHQRFKRSGSSHSEKLPSRTSTPTGKKEPKASFFQISLT